MTTPGPLSWQAILEKNTPELFKQTMDFRNMVMTEGALSVKTKTLMTLLTDALLAHPDGVAGIAKRARAMGATDAEITETLAVAFLAGGLPALVTGSNAFRD